MVKLWQFLQGYPKPAFSEKVQRGDQGKFLKNRPKCSPRLKWPKSSLAKMELSCDLYALRVERVEKILAQTAASKVTEWPSYGNFGKVTQNPDFRKNCKGRTKGIFSKITQKVAPV